MTIAKYPPAISQEVVTDRWTEPFWAHAREGRLVIATCGACRTMRMPPGPYCPVCRSQDIEWRTLSGQGTVYSYTVVRRSIIAGMEDSIPYVPAVVTLEGANGNRLVSAVVKSPIEDIRIDAPVALVWSNGPGGQPVPYFRLLT